MSATGTATLDFGAFPGTGDCSVSVSGQTAIQAGALVEAWILPTTTTDDSVDEHMVERIKVVAANVVAGTGFTIYGFYDGVHYQNDSQRDGLSGTTNAGRLYGQWIVA